MDLETCQTTACGGAPLRGGWSNIYMFSVYILQSETSARYYIGSTADLAKRVKRHNANRNKSTRLQGPWRVVYEEDFPTRQDAYRREMEIKNYKGGIAFKKIVG